MTSFTVYDPATGTILRSGFVLDPDDAASQAGAGEALLLGVAGNRKSEKVDTTQSPPTVVPQ